MTRTGKVSYWKRHHSSSHRSSDEEEVRRADSRIWHRVEIGALGIPSRVMRPMRAYFRTKTLDRWPSRRRSGAVSEELPTSWNCQVRSLCALPRRSSFSRVNIDLRMCPHCLGDILRATPGERDNGREWHRVVRKSHFTLLKEMSQAATTNIEIDCRSGKEGFCKVCGYRRRKIAFPEI